MRIGPRDRGVFILTLLAAVVLCLGIAWCLPIGLGSSTDEWGHFEYAGYLWDKAALPGAKALGSAQVTHPFLYYAYVAGFRAILPSGVNEQRRDSIDLPYERRVVINGGPAPDPMLPRLAPDPAGAAPAVNGIAPHIWRLSGIPLLVIVIILVFRTAWAVRPGGTALATLAAAVGVLVLQLVATFATIMNDQFAVLFGSAGCAAVAVGVARGRLTPLRLLAAGLLFALGLLSKATAIGALVSAAVLVFFFARRPFGTRIRDLLLLGMPSGLGAGWWYVGRMIETGHSDPILMVGARHPDLLRGVSPDLFGYAETLAEIIRTWMWNPGVDGLKPGDLMETVGALVPVMVIGGSVLVAATAGASRIDRVIAGAFLIGVALMVLLLILGTRYSYLRQGRYMLPMVVPGTLACEVAARHLFGRHAGKVLAACVTWFAIMGITFLHVQLIPRYHPPHDRFTSPDFVAYVDAGVPWAAPFTERGTAGWEPAWAPRPEGSFIYDQQEVRLRLSGLEPDGAYVAWLRVHPVARLFMAEELFADDLPLGGAVMPHAVPGWLSFPVPRGATIDGSVSISARALGGGATLAELLLTRVPFRVVLPVRLDRDALHVALTSIAPKRVPRLQARVVGQSGGASGLIEVHFSGEKCDLDIPLSAEFAGALSLELLPPVGVWSDVKISNAVVSPAERAVHRESPGFDVAQIPEGVRPGTVVFNIPDMKLAPGHYKVEFVDERTRPIPKGRLTIVWPGGERVDAADAEFAVTDGEKLRCEVRYAGGAPFIVDRVRLWHAQPWIYDLGVRR